MSTARYLIGDVFDRLATLEDGSVDLVLTSPPFLALRSYLPAGHVDKGREFGSEPSPAAFIDALLAVTAEWRRVLAPHGSICVELGDTFSGSSGDGGDNRGSARYPAGRSFITTRRDRSTNWPLEKSLSLVPELYRIALAYGINPLTGVESPAGRWRVRNVVRWCRPNPPVGSLGDKFRPATTDLVVACVARDRYFDLDAVREPLKLGSEKPRSYAEGSKTDAENGQAKVHNTDGQTSNPNGAPLLDWWELPSHPYRGAHYATWPPALCVRPIKAMSPERVCRVCGEPSRRIVETTRVSEANDSTRVVKAAGYRLNGHDHPPEVGWEMDRATLGWTDCGHDDWRRGLVLDPFAGSGTTLAVASGLGRDSIGIDLDGRNADLARDRVGMFLTVDGDELARPIVDTDPLGAA